MKKLALFAIFSLLSGFSAISAASAQVPRKCLDNHGKVMCHKHGCESYCRPAAPVPPPHHVKPVPVPPPHHVKPVPVPPPPHHVKPVPVPPPPHHVKPVPVPPPHHHIKPNDHHKLSLERQIDELKRDNRHYRKQLSRTFNPYERRHLESAIERNNREIDRLERDRRYYR